MPEILIEEIIEITQEEEVREVKVVGKIIVGVVDRITVAVKIHLMVLNRVSLVINVKRKVTRKLTVGITLKIRKIPEIEEILIPTKMRERKKITKHW